MTKQLFRMIPGCLMLVLLLAACGVDDDGAETAAAKDVALPNGIETAFPLPAEAAVRTTTEYEHDTRAIFHIPMTYAEGVEFYNEGFARHGWTTEHSASDDPRTGARWDAQGHGVNLIFTLTAPMGDAGPLTGSLMVFHPD